MAEWRIRARRIRLLGALAALARDEQGSVLLYFTIIMVVILGLTGLVVDGSSLITLNNQLQALADASALAGAKELKREPGAICAARDAAQNYLDNDPRWSWSVVGLSGLQIQEPEFYGPGIDDGPLAYSCSSPTASNSNDNVAGYIKVTTVTRQVTPLLLSAVGVSSNASTSASATAGNDLVACDTPPMYICNPFETAGMSYEQATAAFKAAVANAATRGKMISLRRDPGGSTLTPGNYGFLDSQDTHGFAAVRDAIARTSSPACFKQSTVNLQTGFAGNSIAPAFNVRFDIYSGSMSANKSDKYYAPATNVRKGYWLGSGSNWCNAGPCSGNATCNPDGDPATVVDDMAMGLPPDATPNVLGPLGAGDWDFDTYWSKNHPGVAAPNGWSNSNRPSRYDVYQYEISQGPNPGGLQDASAPGMTAPTPNPQEIGAPRCNINVPPPGDDRRLMTGAVINCLAAGPLNGSEKNVPVIGFGRFFLIKPVNSSTDGIDAEVVKMLTPGAGGGGGTVYRIVQLYR